MQMQRRSVLLRHGTSELITWRKLLCLLLYSPKPYSSNAASIPQLVVVVEVDLRHVEYAVQPISLS